MAAQADGAGDKDLQDKMNLFRLHQAWINKAIVASIALLTMALRLGYGPRTVDDAFITFRYARNLAEGAGFVFNLGERVLGTTTPLFTILIAGFYQLRLEPTWMALLTTSLADAGTSILIFLIVHRLSRNLIAGWIGASLYSFSTGSITFSGGGMETGLFVFLTMLSVYLFIQRQSLLAATSAALATLTRPEGAMVLLVMGCLYLFRFHRIPWGMIGVSLSLGIPWVLFATFYFGSPFPQSMIAKESTYAFPPLTALKSLLGYLVVYTLPTASTDQTRLVKYGVVILITALSSMVAVIYRRQSVIRKQDAPAILWCIPATYLAAYAVANPPVWEWYALPVVPFAIIFLVMGVTEGGRVLTSRRRRGEAIVSSGLVLLLVATFVLGVLNTRHVLSADIRSGRELVYIAIAQRIAPIARPGDSLATPEIGTLGYYLPKVTILDTQGLVSPSAVPHRQEVLKKLAATEDFQTLWFASGMVPPSLIYEQKPRFVIAPEKVAAMLLQDRAFLASYREFLKAHTALMGSSSIIVWQRME
ncbi:MAG TPA: hypothetical protein GX400_04055 [Chloroflexi bacterium]|nr:hypothetical protein [Chloroflexota bacterium]